MGQEPQNLSVTTVVKRKVKTGKESEYELLMKKISSEALLFPGHEGVNLIQPSKDDAYYTVIFRFDSIDSLTNWNKSEKKELLLQEMDLLTINTPEVYTYESINHWFDLDKKQDPKPPKKYKMILATIIGIYPILTIVMPQIQKLPYVKFLFSHNIWISVFFSSVIVVSLMTYVSMPLVIRILKPWLFSNK